MNRCNECKNKDICICVPYGCECFEIDLEKHDAKVRTDAIEEVKSKMISFHTDAIFQYGADIIEAKSDAFDELKDWLKNQTT